MFFKKLIMKISKFLFLLLFSLCIKIFAQDKSSIIVRSCVDKDPNKDNTFFLLHSDGSLKKLEKMKALGDVFDLNRKLYFMYDENSKKVGCINYEGDWVIKPQFEYELYSSFKNGFAVVREYQEKGLGNLGKVGVIDSNLNWKINPIYNAVSFNLHQDGISLVEDSERVGWWIDINGEKIGEFDKIDFGGRLFNGQIVMAALKNKKQSWPYFKDNEFGLFSLKENKWLTDRKYETQVYRNLNCRTNLIPAGIKGKWGFIGTDGKVKLPFKYNKTNEFIEGLSLVNFNGKWGFIDEKNNEKIPIKYEALLEFSEGLAAAKLSGKWGYIDKFGNTIIDHKFKSVTSFSYGKAFVDSTYFIDKKGVKINLKLPREYLINNIPSWNNDFILVDNHNTLKNSLVIDVFNWKGKLIWKGKCSEGCFPAQSKVRMKDGTEKFIENIKVGEDLLSYNKGKLSCTKVKKIETHILYDETILEINYSNDFSLLASTTPLLFPFKRLLVTKNHPILTSSGETRAENIKVNDKIIVFDNLKNIFIDAKVLSINKKTHLKIKVYNLKTTKPIYLVDDVTVLMK